MQPFLAQVGFTMSKIRFLPVGAFSGVNLVDLKSDAAEPLRQWYKGQTLVELLGITLVSSDFFS
jgi:elongation factor 1 alpha-like protein